MMCRNYFLLCLLVLGISVCGTASSTVVKYNFSQSGYDEGAIVTGMFAGEDLNGDGFIVGNEGPDGFNEVTAFNMEFSGNSIVPAFTLGIDSISVGIVAYSLEGGGLLGDDAGEEIAGSGVVDSSFFLYNTGGPVTGTNIPDGCSKSFCGLVVATDIPSAENYSFEPVIVSAVPLPIAVWLFSSGLLGLIGMRQIKVSTNSD
jgi:hypothetical protein